MHIHFKVVIVAEYRCAYLLAYLLRVQGKALVGAACFDLEGAGSRERVRKIFDCGAAKLAYLLFGICRAADGDDAEGVHRNAPCGVHVGGIILRFYARKASALYDAVFAHLLKAVFQLTAEKRLKIAAVCALEADLTVLAKQYFSEF